MITMIAMFKRVARSDCSRRKFLGSALAATAVVAGLAGGLAPVPGHAQDVEQSKAFVQDVADRLLALVRAPGTAQDKRDALKALLDETAAMSLIARYAVGRPWKDMSETQRDAYVAAFKNYLSRTYSSRFTDYKGESLEILNATDQGKKGVFVLSQVKIPGGEPIDVEWRVSDRSGSLQIIDLYVAGVSMLITQRDEFTAMLDQRGGNIDAFISELTQRGTF
ncbi:MAG: ABC transporter substrate-binding protein [Neomegalonema sp.]|nr:ABC transporter substrate-binding protein [Neomegalonema sp.]